MHQVDTIRLLEDITPSATSPASANTQVVSQSTPEEDDNRCRLEFAKRSLTRRNGQPRYVIKKLSQETILKASSPFEERKKEYLSSVVDLAMEA